MKKYSYQNYQNYLNAQIDTTTKKMGKMSWIEDRIINTIADYVGDCESVLCHGTRSGEEQIKFKERFGEQCFVVGSELHPDGAKYPMTVVHDFNEVYEEWVGRFSIVYSNALDHCFDPEKTLSVWSDQVNENGKLIIEWHPGSGGHSNVSASDPFTATDFEIGEIMLRNNFKIEATLLPNKTKHAGSLLIYSRG